MDNEVKVIAAQMTDEELSALICANLGITPDIRTMRLPMVTNDDTLMLYLLRQLLRERPYKQILLDNETNFTEQPRPLNECEADHDACIFQHLHIYIVGKGLNRAVAEAYVDEMKLL